MAIGLSMVLLDADEPIHAADLQREFETRWPKLPAVTDIEEGDGTVAMQVGEASVIMAKMPVPMPWSDLEGPCETSLLWPDAKETVKKHALHWIVTVSGELDPYDLSTLLTQATAAAMSACSAALGVYWGNATMLIRKDVFVDFATDILPQGPPLHIWVDFRVGKDTERTSGGFTVGMKALGHMEFETQKAPEPPGELRDRLMGLAGYVIENGPVIRDGNTVGQDAKERIRVAFGKSAFGHEGKVMRLVYENASPAKPWWKLW